MLVPARRPRLSWPAVRFALHTLQERAVSILFWLASAVLGRALAIDLASRLQPVSVKLDELELAGDVDARLAARAALEELRARGYDASFKVDAARESVFVGTTRTLAFVDVPSRRVDAVELTEALRWALAMDGARQTIELVIEAHGERGARLLAAAVGESPDGIARAVRCGGFSAASARMALRDAWTKLRRVRGADVAGEVLVRVVATLHERPGGDLVELQLDSGLVA